MSALFDTLSELKEAIRYHETRWNVKYINSSSSKGFGDDDCIKRALASSKRVLFEEITSEESKRVPLIDFCGSPFLVIGDQRLECASGAPRKESTTVEESFEEDAEHQHKRHYKKVQVSKKLNCSGKVLIKELLYFPEFSISANTKSRRAVMSLKLRSALQTFDETEPETEPKTQRCFVARFSPDGCHSDHYTGLMSLSCLPTDTRVLAKMQDLVKSGVRRVQEMQRHIRRYVVDDLFGGLEPPSLSDARFSPSSKTVLNCIYRTVKKASSSDVDEENAHHLLQKWRSDGLKDLIELNFRHFESDDHEANESTNNVIFCHQSLWQQKMMRLYGSDIVLIDATYNTTLYGLPLLILCVPTNAGYFNVATILLADETQDSLTAALQQIASWNPGWKPRYFMSDFCEGQINAIEFVFPGCEVLLCKFHRLQAWNRHLSKHPMKGAILKMLEIIAMSSTDEEYADNLSVLTHSSEWVNDPDLQQWLVKKWLPHYKRWVRAYSRPIWHSSVTTTNGVERQHEHLKYSYLNDKCNGRVTDVITVIVEDFVPACQRSYEELNVRQLHTVRRYNDHVPTFLRNRPKHFQSHCLNRLIPSVSAILPAQIEDRGHGLYMVRSSDSANTYRVQMSDHLDPNLPFCGCFDWAKHHLPCKHLLAVLTLCPSSGGWDGLPLAYRSFPQFNLDPEVMLLAHPVASPVLDDCDLPLTVFHSAIVDVDTAIVATPTVDTAIVAAQTVVDVATVVVVAPTFDPVVTVPTVVISASNSAHVAPTVGDPGRVMSNGFTPQVFKLQSRLRQALAAIASCTYNVDDTDAMESALCQCRKLLVVLKAVSIRNELRVPSSRRRRLVKSSINSTSLKRRLQVISARKRQRRNRQKFFNHGAMEVKVDERVTVVVESPTESDAIQSQESPNSMTTTCEDVLAVRPSGFLNLGNTCFLNAIVQFLRSSIRIARIVTAHLEQHKNQDCTTCCLGHALQGRMETLFNHILMHEDVLLDYREGAQFDAHECLMNLLRRIQLNAGFDIGLGEIEQTLQIISHGKVTCMACSAERDTQDTMLCLSLAVPEISANRSSIDVQAVIDGQQVPEEIVLNCEISSCEGQRAMKHFSHYKSPDILLVHLKRWSDRSGVKSDVKVSPSQTLSITDENLSVTYGLRAMITHVGSAQQGHYKAISLCGSQWMCCNDTSVSNISVHKVLAPTDTMYICMYERNTSGNCSPLQTAQMKPQKRVREAKIVLESCEEDDCVDNVMDSSNTDCSLELQCLKDVRKTFMELVEDARAASAWLVENKELFHSEVHEPWPVQATDADIITYIEEQMRNGVHDFSDIRDNLMFNFHSTKDIDTFYQELIRKGQLKLNICLFGDDFLKDIETNCMW